MKKLSLIIAAVLFFTGISVISAQPGQGGGVPGHGGVNPPGHGGTPPGLGGGATNGNDNIEAAHGVEISIPTVALVDVEGVDGEAGTINLTPDVTSLEAGNAVDFSDAKDNSLWLNYTSIIASDQDERNITTEIDGTLPAGVSLNLLAGGVSLTTNGQNLVTGIGSGYTESGYEKGHQLTYSLEMANESYAELTSGTYNLTVTYTITGN
jgi:hypothetical protein